MSEIKRILFPTDFSEPAVNAFRYALWFADRHNASIDLWHFVSPELAPADIPVVSAELTQQKLDVAKEVMQTFTNNGITQVQTAHELNAIPDVQGNVEVGPASRRIREKAKERKTDLIIMGTQGEHGTLERIFGSVTTATLEKSDCPVLVIPDNVSSEKLMNVSFASDLKEYDPFHIWEVMKILSPYDVKYRVVHIEKESDDKDELDLQELKSFFEERSPETEISFHSLIGDDRIELLEDFCNRYEIDLLAMFRPKHSFFESIFHNSLTRQIALHTSVPLLILK